MPRILFTLLLLPLLLLSCQVKEVSDLVKPITDKIKLPGIASHPSKLQFEAMDVALPDREKYRYQLSGNNIAYIIEDKTLPLVSLKIIAPRGRYIQKGATPGLSSLTQIMLTDGGTKKMAPLELREELDFLASYVNVSIGDFTSVISLDTLSKNFDQTLSIVMDMLTQPRFDSRRLRIAKKNMIEQIKKRNDDTETIEHRVWDRLFDGDAFWTNNLATKRAINTIKSAQIQKHADALFSADQLIFAVSGDIDIDQVQEKLNRFIHQLPVAKTQYTIDDSSDPYLPGLYVVEKSDVNQSRVRLGLPSIAFKHPDHYAMKVLNEILGGSSSSRLFKRVRSDEGLAYVVRSRYTPGFFLPGRFEIDFQSKNESINKALHIVLKEIDRLQQEEVSDQELALAKQSVTAGLYDLFDSAEKMSHRFASDQRYAFPDTYWKEYKKTIQAVTKADIIRAANDHLRKDRLFILVTGAIEKLYQGDEQTGNLQEVAKLPIKKLPLRDPLTLKPLAL